ncbi:MAG: thymidine kinase [Thermoanaerobacteraceae bacterium]|nr:thymidine kinase [Thermoanaerobacteraceae bacterium]
MVGKLEVIRGCMFSGKTEELIRRLHRLKYAKQTYLLFKPAIDNRYEEAHVVSHNGFKLQARPIEDSEDILEDVLRQEAEGNHYDVIGVDEVQFLDRGIIEVSRTLIHKGYRVILAGLDTDFRGEPFGPMGELLAIADEDERLYAICSVCGQPAIMTQRIINGEPAHWDDPTILVGGTDRYEARCREHHIVIK